MKEKYILCELQGVRDLEIKLFTEEEADWITYGGPLPDSLKKHIEQEWISSGDWTKGQIDDEIWEFEHTNDWNDRALGFPVNKDRWFFDSHSYAKWYKNNDVDIVDRYYGGQY